MFEPPASPDKQLVLVRAFDYLAWH